MYPRRPWPLVIDLNVAALLLLNRSIDKLELHGTILERRAIPHTLCYTCAFKQSEVEDEALPCHAAVSRAKTQSDFTTELKLIVGVIGHPHSSRCDWLRGRQLHECARYTACFCFAWLRSDLTMTLTTASVRYQRRH